MSAGAVRQRLVSPAPHLYGEFASWRHDEVFQVDEEGDDLRAQPLLEVRKTSRCV